MRAWPIVALGVSLGLTATASAVTVMAGDRQASFARNAATLEQRWKHDVTAGEPAASLAPLRSQLAASPYRTAPSWSPEWWFGTGQSLLDSLEKRTAQDWTAAMDAARGQAAAVFTNWDQLAAQLSTYIPADCIDRRARVEPGAGRRPDAGGRRATHQPVDRRHHQRAQRGASGAAQRRSGCVRRA